MDQNSEYLQIQSLEEQLRQREYEIQLLTETTQAIGSQLHLDKVFDIIARRARELINAETILIPILNKDFSEYTYRAGAGANDVLVLVSINNLTVYDWQNGFQKSWKKQAFSLEIDCG